MKNKIKLWVAGLTAVAVTYAAEVHLVEEPEVQHQRLEDGTLLLDF